MGIDVGPKERRLRGIEREVRLLRAQFDLVLAMRAHNYALIAANRRLIAEVEARDRKIRFLESLLEQARKI